MKLSRRSLLILFLVVGIVATIILKFCIDTYEPNISVEAPPERLQTPFQETVDTTTPLKAGWERFDSVASGEISARTHFAFEHPAFWYNKIMCNDMRCGTVFADYDVNRTVPDEKNPSIGRAYQPEEYCRAVVITDASSTNPDVIYENTYTSSDQLSVCKDILKHIEASFWFDFSEISSN